MRRFTPNKHVSHLIIWNATLRSLATFKSIHRNVACKFFVRFLRCHIHKAFWQLCARSINHRITDAHFFIISFYFSLVFFSAIIFSWHIIKFVDLHLNFICLKFLYSLPCEWCKWLNIWSMANMKITHRIKNNYVMMNRFEANIQIFVWVCNVHRHIVMYEWNCMAYSTGIIIITVDLLCKYRSVIAMIRLENGVTER